MVSDGESAYPTTDLGSLKDSLKWSAGNIRNNPDYGTSTCSYSASISFVAKGVAL